MITSKSILKILEDLSPSVGNVSSYSLTTRSEIKDRILSDSKFAKSILDHILKSDYSYYITTKDGFDTLDPKEVNDLILNNIDIAYQIVNYYKLH